MILYCGVTKEEIFEPGICVDMMIDGGTADEPLNIYEVEDKKSTVYFLTIYINF